MKCSWDEEDVIKDRRLHSFSQWRTLNESDFQQYIASSDSEDDEDEKQKRFVYVVLFPDIFIFIFTTFLFGLVSNYDVFTYYFLIIVKLLLLLSLTILLFH